MSPAPRTVVAREGVRASHSWTKIRASRRLRASHSWTYCEPRPADDTDTARDAA
jgi:hypothetical protein